MLVIIIINIILLNNKIEPQHPHFLICKIQLIKVLTSSAAVE